MEKEFWKKRWQDQETGWDIGYPSTPLKNYIDQLEDKSLKILIPGAGNAYEAEYLWENGFENIFVIDIAEEAIVSFHKRFPNFPESHLICGDFFEHTGQYDLILEQTFFCAIDPIKRADYTKKMFELLKTNGKITGLLFDFPLESGPPFGGNEEEYRIRFGEHFKILKLEKAFNSIPPRENREFFFQVLKA